MANRYKGFAPDRGYDAIGFPTDEAGPGGSPGKAAPGGGSGGGGGVGGPPDHANPGGQGGGRPDGAGSKKGDLYGDQYVLLRDMDPTDGGGDGQPVLDANGQPILIGSDGTTTFPIYFEADAEGDFEIPPDMVPYVQEVELERANVARAPDHVTEKALDEALSKIAVAETVATDMAGRLVLDGVTIDSPLENLALYHYLMTAGGKSGWPDVVDHWPDALKALAGADLTDPDWDPSSLLGAAFSKALPVTLDAVIAENTVLGVNEVSQVNGVTTIAYFDFTVGDGTAAATESYDYDRQDQYGDTYVRWFENTDGDPDLEAQEGWLMDVVFGGQTWSDTYIAVDPDSADQFVEIDATDSGINDFAQAVDDARAVINFMHEYMAVEINPPLPDDAMLIC